MRKTTETMKSVVTLARAYRVSNVSEDLFIRGLAFSARDVITVQPKGTAITYLHFDPRKTCNLQFVFEPLLFVAAEAGPIIITFYHSPTLTDGGRTAITTFNRRATAPIQSCAAAVEFVAPANVSAVGTKFSAQLVASASGGGSAADVGAVSAGGLPFEINPNTDYLISLSNENGSPSTVEYNVTWFENPV